MLSLGFVLSVAAITQASAQRKIYKIITTIESVVPGGLGRSRMVSVDSTGKFEEKGLNNFFSLVGINFGNVKENDVNIQDKLNEISRQGWDLHDVTSGVYSAETSTGIFITRYIFSRNAR